MEIKELLTIKEFAELSGKTRQTIYQQLNSRLKDYLQVIDNVKMLESRALKEVYGIDPENLANPSIESGLEQIFYEILRDELKSKNEQILALQEEIAKERQHSREQAEKIAVFADQAQKLLLAQMQPQITEEAGKEGSETMDEKRGIFESIGRWFKKIPGD